MLFNREYLYTDWHGAKKTTAYKLKKDTLIIYWYDETEVLLKKK
ncbi:hypothetical protein HMPREF3218_0200264 [Prevotella bivia]|uniref:Uncharacterized protein n=1 Tax=Prevotella bivia TaxID=28125 RepID=A0A137SSG2_9BACT|nr:hypothetical protein HMPREF3202_01845 [Prevotella bivia]KXU59940.1 hypothetical protein HMPREF3218_0200264 [Prevotella bivia]